MVPSLQDATHVNNMTTHTIYMTSLLTFTILAVLELACIQAHSPAHVLTQTWLFSCSGPFMWLFSSQCLWPLYQGLLAPLWPSLFAERSLEQECPNFSRPSHLTLLMCGSSDLFLGSWERKLLRATNLSSTNASSLGSWNSRSKASSDPGWTVSETEAAWQHH